MSKKVCAITVHCTEDLALYIKLMAERTGSTDGGYLRTLAEADKAKMKHEYTLLHQIFGGEPSMSSDGSLTTTSHVGSGK